MSSLPNCPGPLPSDEERFISAFAPAGLLDHHNTTVTTQVDGVGKKDVVDSFGAIPSTFPVPVSLYRALPAIPNALPHFQSAPCTLLRHWWLRQIISRYIIYPSSKGRVRHASCALQQPMYNHLGLGSEWESGSPSPSPSGRAVVIAGDVG